MNNLINNINYFYKLAIFNADEFNIPMRNVNLFINKYLDNICDEISIIRNELYFDKSNKNYLDFFHYLGIKYDLESLNYILKRLEEEILQEIKYNKIISDDPSITFSTLKVYKYKLLDIDEQLSRVIYILESIISNVNQLSTKDFDSLQSDYNINYNVNFADIKNSILKLKNKNNQYLILLNNTLKHSELRIKEQGNISGEKKLYHATTNAKEISLLGFKSAMPDSEGLGGSTAITHGTPGISFTSDLYVAKEIARCLKEVILISKGYLDGYDILSWSTIPDQIAEANRKVNGKNDLISPEGSLDLYKIYLFLEPKRYDPLFMIHSSKMIEIFKNKNEEDVGIIQATVNLIPNKYKYFDSMHEFRVLPEDVISIDKVIK